MGFQVAKKRRQRRRFTDQYKAEVVELVRTSGKSTGQIARELDLTDSAVRDWVKAADARDARATSSAEQDVHAELREAKKRIKELEMEKAILKKAAGLFARENS